MLYQNFDHRFLAANTSVALADVLTPLVSGGCLSTQVSISDRLFIAVLLKAHNKASTAVSATAKIVGVLAAGHV